MNRIDLEGQSAIVTGGAQGLGFAMAQRIAQSGAKVSLWDMNEDRLAAAAAEIGAQPPKVTLERSKSDKPRTVGGPAAKPAPEAPKPVAPKPGIETNFE